MQSSVSLTLASHRSQNVQMETPSTLIMQIGMEMKPIASLTPHTYTTQIVKTAPLPNSTKQARSKTPSIQSPTSPQEPNHRNQYHPNRTAFHVSTCTIHIKPPFPKPQISLPPLLRLCLDLHLPSPPPLDLHLSYSPSIKVDISHGQIL